MRIVIALGGNALLKRGEPLTVENQRRNVRIAAEAIASLASEHELIISHGNGPQVGQLALQSSNYNEEDAFPLDILGAQTEGMIGYIIEQELGNILPFEQPLASILTMVEVDADDPAFDNPTKPIGPEYSQGKAKELAHEKGWTVKKDGKMWRRVVPSPFPKRIFEIRPVKWLLEKGTIVICTGGGGIPTVYNDEKKLDGAEVVVDKDYAGALLASELDADLYVMATDAEGVFLNWGTENATLLKEVRSDELSAMKFDEGSMGPNVAAACWFVNKTGKKAVIGDLKELANLVNNDKGTRVIPC